MKENHEQF